MVWGKCNPEAIEMNSEGYNLETTYRNSEGGKGNPEVSESNLGGGGYNSPRSINPFQKHEKDASEELLTWNQDNEVEENN